MSMGDEQRWGDAPAVLVVDLSRKRADPDLETAYPSVVRAADRVAALLTAARQANVPVFFSRGGKSYYTSRDAGLTEAERGGWAKQNALAEGSGRAALDLAPQVEPAEDEPVITKSAPSAFFNTMLPVYLASHGTDTLVVAGIHTSGCVRATVVDAFSHDFWVVVPRECVSDGRAEAHEYHVAEIDRKYADVVPVDRVMDYLDDGID